MLNCKETIRLCSESLDHRLSFWQRFNLRMHLMMCGACSAYKRQVEGLHRLFGARRRQPGDPSLTDAAGESQKLSPQRREHIKRLLDSDHGH